MSKLSELEDLNRQAWATGRPFIATEYGTFRAISPEMIRDQRLMNGILNASLDALKFSPPSPHHDEEFYFGWCIGEMK